MKRRSNRRPSDASLMSILQHPVVQTSFNKFLKHECSEELCQFWYAVWKFHAASDSRHQLTTKQRKAQAYKIYDVYLRDGAPNLVRLDKATRQHIELDLQIDSKGRVSQSDVRKINSAFETAFMKVFNQLKFEYMPRFLVSEEFENLVKDKNQGPVFSDSEDKETSAFAVTADIDIGYLVTDAYGMFYSKEFLHSKDASSLQFKHYDTLFELILDIDNYRSYTKPQDKTYRLQRLRCIIQRYGRITASLQLKKLEDLVNMYIKASCQEKLAEDLNICEGIRAEALVKLSGEFLEKFKESRYFAKMRGDVSDFGFAVTTIPRLKSFAEERMLAVIEKDTVDMTLIDILQDGLGKYYFKLFSREHFQEENLLFWCEVESFKIREFYHADQFANAASSIYEKFIGDKAPMQVNIEKRMQEKAHKVIDEHTTNHSKGRELLPSLNTRNWTNLALLFFSIEPKQTGSRDKWWW